jgi:hypothetical protein
VDQLAIEVKSARSGLERSSFSQKLIDIALKADLINSVPLLADGQTRR